MTTNFQFVAMNKAEFDSFTGLSEQELSRRNAKWLVADSNPGYPCRVSMKNAEIGERVLALSYCFQDTQSPFRASGPIYIRENAEMANPRINEVPQFLMSSLLSVRAYSKQDMLVAADVVEGESLQTAICNQFSDSAVEYLHIHYAKHGCFSSLVRRA